MKRVRALMAEGLIEIAPSGYMRGGRSTTPSS
jgi:phosphate starvation-inducible protein PhoH